MSSYRFFFSYASETHVTSQWTNQGQIGYFLEEFYQALCNQVAAEAGDKADKVGYRDQDRLKLADFWKPNIVDALQQSRVLVAVISPHYLKSLYCGRELEFFRQRFESLKEAGHQQEEHRIIPVFWIDQVQCAKGMPDRVKLLFDNLQHKQKNMPADYPVIGLHSFYALAKMPERYAVLIQLAKRICELSDLQPLPTLLDNVEVKFDDFPSFFESKTEKAASMVASGPSGTNVVYAVATKNEMEDHEVQTSGCYPERRQDFSPFADARGASIELATREGLNLSGQNDSQYRSLGLPDDLVDKIKQAKKSNSPVLIVLDQPSLRIQTIETQLSAYDETDFLHVGVVTAAGNDADASLVEKVLPTKYKGKRANHLWIVPSTRNVYVQGVSDVASSLKTTLQQTGEAAVAMPVTSIPGI